MSRLSRGARLARRYPVLAHVPENERAAIVRSVLRRPFLLIPLVVAGLALLPLYLDSMFLWLGVHDEQNPILMLAMLAGAGFLPIVILVPLLTRLVMPPLLRKEMAKRGYGATSAPSADQTTPRSTTSMPEQPSEKVTIDKQ